MKCTDFENRIELLFDDNTPAEVRREMLEHLETCPACAEFYRQTKAAFNAVAPRVEVQAPAGLKARILKTAAQAENTPATARTTAPARPRRLWLRPLSATLSAAALIALVLLVFDPVGRYRAHAAGRIFRDAAAQLDKSRSFRLEMNVRTLPQENFSYIDAEVPFVPHRMWVEPGSGRWRLEKAGRIALSDGERILMWSPEINSGFIMRPGSGAIEDFATLLDTHIITAAEQQTMNYYMNIGTFYDSDLGRRLYQEIGMIEEQHVTQYGALLDPGMTWLENLLLHEYTECYLYWSCVEDETDLHIKKIWEQHFEQECSHLHAAEALLKQYEGKEACQIIPDGTFPELLRFGPQKEYLRKVLKTTILNTAVQDDPTIPVETLTKDAPYYAYQAAVCPDAARVASHQVIEEHIGTSGKDYRFEEKPHPVEALRDRTQDNTTIARGKI